jgi:hypothetical protein
MLAVACGGLSRRELEPPGGAASDAGTIASASDEFTACLNFVRTVCNKLFFECRGAPDADEPCPPSVDSSCPNRYFSPGATVDVASLVSCAGAWRSATCDDLRAGKRPDCVPRGTFDDQAACVFGAQCASGFCAASTEPDGSPGCGTCMPVAHEGEACATGAVHCADGLECHGTCTPSAPFGLPPLAACDGFNNCTSGYYCLELPGDDGPRCHPPPALGDACPLDIPYCAGNCDMNGVCMAAPILGNACALGGNAAHTCETGLRCDLTTPGGPTCTRLLHLGAPCRPLNADFSSGGCERGALCHCDDAACESGTCVVRREAGAPCDGPYDVCIAGTSCEAGRCKPSGLQQRFASACGG